MYGLGNNGGTPGGRLGGAFPEGGKTQLHSEKNTDQISPPPNTCGPPSPSTRSASRPSPTTCSPPAVPDQLLTLPPTAGSPPPPDVVATELRVEAVTVELLLRLKPRLLTLLRLEETLTTGGAAETVLEEVEKVLAEEWRLASLSTLVC